MEGPSVRAIVDRLEQFVGKTVIGADGNTKEAKENAVGKPVLAIFSRGKNLFIQLADFSFKIHFLMFGSYRVNEERDGMAPRLSLSFDSGAIHFYNCSVKLFPNEQIDEQYPEELDITSSKWNMERAVTLALEGSNSLVCDLLLDQDIFLGVGNIIKNEALWMAKTHPLSLVQKLPRKRLQDVAAMAREFSLVFYRVKQTDTRLNAHCRIYRKRKCPSCAGKITGKKTGTRKRISFFCPACQTLYQ